MHSLFVKFHKVAGTTWQLYLLRMIGEYYDCSSLCGNPDWVCEQKAGPNSPEAASCKGQSDSWAAVPFCQDPRPRSCTAHPSTDVIREAVSGQTLAVANSDLSDLRNLYSDEKRLELLARVPWARSWLPSTFIQKRVRLTTILREPTERLRSYYYYDNAYSSREGFGGFLRFCRDYVAGNWTLEQFERQKSLFRGAKSLAILRRSCCEYERYLGEESLEKSLVTLSTMFDLVGLQEKMDESLVTLGRLYGLTPHEVAEIGRSVPPDCNSNSDKLDWTEEELRLAGYVSSKSLEIYKLGQQLF
ncbi:STR8, partial [Symbiodinium natans]